MPSPFADAAGYQPHGNPRAVAVSAAIHIAGITALLLMPAAVAVLDDDARTEATNIPIDPVAPPPPPDPVTDPVKSNPRDTVIETPRPPLDVNRNKPPVETGKVTDDPPLPPVGGTDEGTGAAPAPTPSATPSTPPPPIIVNATLNQRFASRFQPDYPADEARMGREGRVKIRVLVGPNGRAIRAERLEATSDSFWRATERQALAHWRFNPATQDGRAVEGWFTVSVVFRLDEAR